MMPPKTTLFKGLAVLIGLVLISWAGLKIKSNLKKPEMPAMPTPRVTTAVPVRKAISSFLEFTGTTEAVNSIEIRARIPGYLQNINFIGNTDVNKGDVLFTIEPDSYKAKRDRAFANLKSSEAELLRAQKDLERMEKAVKSDSVSKQKVSTVKSQRDQAAAAVLAKKASLAEAELELSYTKVCAPIGGRISRHFVDVGNLIGSSENTLLATIVDIDPIHVYFKVNERILLKRLKERVKEGINKKDAEVYIGLTDEDGYPHKGKVDYIDNRVDSATGTINVRAIVPNPDKTILPGMFVRISAPNGTNDNALLVEEKSLGTDFNGKYLLIVGKNNLVEQRPVVTGNLIDGMRVIKEGLSDGEAYIVSGLQFARAGMPVTPMKKGDMAMQSQALKK
jgi:RND family efflux transporter MFP subunit